LLLVAIYALSTPWRRWCHQPVGQPSAIARHGCSAGVEQFATADQRRLLTTDIPAEDLSFTFPSVI